MTGRRCSTKTIRFRLPTEATRRTRRVLFQSLLRGPRVQSIATAILTGLSPVTSGVYSNGQSWKQLLPDVVTLPQYFGQHGFATKGGGKIFHHGGTGTDRADNPSFDEFFKLRIHSGKPKTNYNGYKRGDEGVRGLATPGWDWGVHDVDKQTDEYTVEYVSKAMKSESRDKPLFLAAGIFRPHLPFWAPPEVVLLDIRSIR